MSNEEIGEAYRQRWAIEVLWKFLKMNLKLDKMMSKNLNGITIQIYVILIVYLILKLLKIPRIYRSKLVDKFRYIQILIRQEWNFVHKSIGKSIDSQLIEVSKCKSRRAIAKHTKVDMIMGRWA